MDYLQHDSLIIALAVLLAGLSFGSFVTLASYRLPRDLDIVRKPSMCPACETPLRPRDLVPLLSWMLGGGKCRHCGARVSLRYPLTELALGGMFLLLYLMHGFSPEGVVLALFATTLAVLIVADLETGLLPDEAQIALLLLAAGYHYVPGTAYAIPLAGLAAGLAVGLGMRYGYRLLKKRDGLGLGDVKLLAVAGLWLGIEGLPPFFLLAGLLGIATAAAWRALGKGAVFPFGPALAASLGACVLFPAVPSHLLIWMTAWYLP